MKAARTLERAHWLGRAPVTADPGSLWNGQAVREVVRPLPAATHPQIQGGLRACPAGNKSGWRRSRPPQFHVIASVSEKQGAGLRGQGGGDVLFSSLAEPPLSCHWLLALSAEKRQTRTRPLALHPPGCSTGTLRSGNQLLPSICPQHIGSLSVLTFFVEGR